MTLPDGKVLLSGGTEAFPEEDQGPNTFKGSKKSYYFDPTDDRFHPTADMAGAHWYPTLTKLGNGDLWAAGGLDEKAAGTVLTEIFDTSAMRWLTPGEVPQTWSFWGTYPHMYLLDDGMLFYAGAHTFGNGLPGTGASLYDWETAQIWDVPGLREKDLRDQAGSVLLPPAQDQRVMIVGGGNTDAMCPAPTSSTSSTSPQRSPPTSPGPTCPATARHTSTCSIFPTARYSLRTARAYNRAGNIFTAAIYGPAANEWKSVPADPIGRNYHSTAILLPDGRVAVLGSNPADNSFELRISVYSPPYLFRGARPIITTAPGAAGYGEVIEIGVTGDVASASLMTPMSATHQTDANARLVDLPISGAGATLNGADADQPEPAPARPLHAHRPRRGRCAEHREVGVDLVSTGSRHPARLVVAAVLLPVIALVAVVALWPRAASDRGVGVSHHAVVAQSTGDTPAADAARSPILDGAVRLDPPPDSPLGSRPETSLAEAAGTDPDQYGARRRRGPRSTTRADRARRRGAHRRPRRVPRRVRHRRAVPADRPAEPGGTRP